MLVFVGSSESNLIKLLNQIVDALKEFKNNRDKKFNFSKLLNYFNFPRSEIQELISLILNFQNLFQETLAELQLNAKELDDQHYLVAQRRDQPIPQYFEICITKENAKLLSDAIYVFQRVNRGKGFELNSNSSELAKKLKLLKQEHPYFFKSNGNGLIYPSETGIEIGTHFLLLFKNKKEASSITYKHYKVEVI